MAKNVFDMGPCGELRSRPEQIKGCIYERVAQSSQTDHMVDIVNMPRGRGLADSSGPRVGCACPLLILDRSGRTGVNATCNQAARAVTEWLRLWASDVGSWCESRHWLCLWGATTDPELRGRLAISPAFGQAE